MTNLKSSVLVSIVRCCNYHFKAHLIMLCIHAILALTALALASPIPKHSLHIVVTPLAYRPSTIDTVDGTVSERGLIVAPRVAASPTAISISSTNTTAHGPSSFASPTEPSFSLPQQSQWGPGDISTVLFGFVATVLATMTIGLTYYLHRRQSQSQSSG